MRTKRPNWGAIACVAMIGAAAVALIASGISGRRADRLRDNEMTVAGAMKSLSSAEADFRANDRDWNHIHDFWTGDVAGLLLYGLIPRELAEADANPLKSIAARPVPYHGYFFIAMDGDDTAKGSEEEFYRRDTGGTPAMGKVHNTSKFGFCAYPAQYGVTGTFTYLINENNTLFKLDNGGKPVMAWPDDSPPRNHDWEKID